MIVHCFENVPVCVYEGESDEEDHPKKIKFESKS